LPVTVPNYIGIDLKIDGHSCKKPNQPNLQQQIATNNIVPSAGISGSSSNSSSNNNTLSNTKKNNESENLTLTGLEIKTNRNSNFTSTSKSNTIAASSSNTPGATSILTNHSNNSSSSNTTTKLKKEATNASISIANSIQELAQKEVQTQNHLANYHSTYRAHNNLSNISYNYLVNLPEKNKRSNVSSSKEDEQDGGGGAVNTTAAAVNTNTSNFISKLDQPSIKPIKTNPSIPKLFQFPSSITNGSTSSMHGFKASPTLVNAHLASLDSNSFSNQPLGAKLNSNLISNQQQQQQQPQQQQQQQQISLSAIPSTIPSNIAKTNKGKLVKFNPAFVSYPNISKIDNYYVYSKNINRQKSFANYYATLLEQEKLRTRLIEKQQASAEQLNNNNITNENNNEKKSLRKKSAKLDRERLVCSSLQVTDFKSFMFDYEYENKSNNDNDNNNNSNQNEESLNLNALNNLDELKEEDNAEENEEGKCLLKTNTNDSKSNKKRPHTSPKIIILKLSKKKNKIHV
jgi:hypothetical protein